MKLGVEVRTLNMDMRRVLIAEVHFYSEAADVLMTAWHLAEK
jgi:hypothetical protein